MKTTIKANFQMEGLEGVSRGGKRKALYIRHATDVELILSLGLCATDAGDNGAINVWEDDKGVIRCEAMRHFSVLDKKNFHNVRKSFAWVRKWMRKIR